MGRLEKIITQQRNLEVLRKAKISLEDKIDVHETIGDKRLGVKRI